MLRGFGAAILLGVAFIAFINAALAQGPASVPPASTLSDAAAMERDRQRSQALSPSERERALRVFDQAFALYQAGDFDSAKLGFERGLGIDPANGNANYYLGDILTRRGDSAGAEARYRRAAFFDPDSAEGLKAQTIVTKLDREKTRKEEENRRRSVRPQDDGEMVRVPAGEFTMGSNDRDDEKPPHRVFLDGFHIDKYEVTNGLYRLFMAATSRAAPSYWNEEKWNGASQPVVGVSWHDADAYCKWAGKRLPTEAEWEKAARGTDGRQYPWGEQWDASRANSDESKLGETVPVGSYPSGVGPYGAHDMAGNVWEWVADWYAKDYYKQSPERNPQGPSSGTRRVLRGGSWDVAFDLRTAYRARNTPDGRNYNVGFRCARGL